MRTVVLIVPWLLLVAAVGLLFLVIADILCDFQDVRITPEEWDDDEDDELNCDENDD